MDTQVETDTDKVIARQTDGRRVGEHKPI